jgi:hypothetical protein
MELTTLLADAGIPIDDAVLLRHADRGKPLPPYALWNYDRAAFERYQSMQLPTSFNVLSGGHYWVAFGANELAETVFLGVYDARGPQLVETPMPNEVDDEFTKVPHYVFRTTLLPHLSWLRGVMKIQWSGADIRWAQAASERPKVITSLGGGRYSDPPGLAAVLSDAPPLSPWRPTQREPRAVPSQPVDVIAWMQRLELRSASHEALLERVAALAAGRVVESSILLDLVVDGRILIEVKSVMSDAVTQVRAALAQLYHYRFVYRKALPNPELLAVFGNRPLDGTTDLAEFLESCGVGTAWVEGGAFYGRSRARTIAPWLFS